MFDIGVWHLAKNLQIFDPEDLTPAKNTDTELELIVRNHNGAEKVE